MGNAYIWAPPGEGRLVRLRPDWVTIVSELVQVPGGGSYRRKIGYWHEPPRGVTGQGAPFEALAADVAHWHPISDPQADFRGMSWLTPVMRDIQGDDAMTRYKIRYLQNNATPNIIIKYAQKLQPATVDAIRDRMTARYGGPDNAGKTLVLDQGADLTLAGNSLTQMDFSNVSVDGVQRILAPSGVPGLLIGLESIKGAGKSYEEVIRRFADLTLRPLWRSMCAVLEQLVPDVPAGSRLWYDTGAIAALQEGEQVRAQVSLIRAQALLALRQAGYDQVSAVGAVESGDMTQLKVADVPPPPPAGNVQHMLPQTPPGVTAAPLPPSTPRLPTGSVSPGDGGNGTRPVPVASAARRALNGSGSG
jgi:phage portal protein BeeE